MLQLFSGRYLPYIYSVDFAFCGATHFYYYSFTHQSRATYLDYSDNKPRYRPNPDLDLCSRTGLDRVGGPGSRVTAHDGHRPVCFCGERPVLKEYRLAMRIEMNDWSSISLDAV